MPTDTATFAASRKPGPTPKPGAADVIGAVVSAIAGDTKGWNGTQNGKRGFQPGNQYGAHVHRNQKVAGAKAAHRDAHAVLRRHSKAGTITTPQGRAALKASVTAARELQAARREHQAATRTAKNAAARDKRADAKALTPATARVGKATATASELIARSAHSKIEALRRGAVAGEHDGDAILDRVDLIERGATKAELFEAARRAGIKHDAKTKKDLVDAIKNHVYDAQLAANEVRRSRPAADPKAEAKPKGGAPSRPTTGASKDEIRAANKQAGHEALIEAARANQVPTGRPAPSLTPKPQPPLPRPAVPITPRPAEKPSVGRQTTRASDPEPRTVPKTEAKAGPPATSTGRSAAELADHIERHASGPMIGTVTGRTDKESMRAFDHGGHRIYFNDTPEGKAKAVEALRQMERQPIPDHVAKHTRNIYLTTGEAQRSHKVEGMKGGRISGVANGRSVSIFGAEYGEHHHAVLAHELSHNFAKNLYGSFSPRADSDFSKAMESGEEPVTRYGRSQPAEDFATSVQSYFENRDYFREHHPRRFAVVERLMKDPNYAG